MSANRKVTTCKPISYLILPSSCARRRVKVHNPRVSNEKSDSASELSTPGTFFLHRNKVRIQGDKVKLQYKTGEVNVENGNSDFVEKWSKPQGRQS